MVNDASENVHPDMTVLDIDPGAAVATGDRCVPAGTAMVICSIGLKSASVTEKPVDIEITYRTPFVNQQGDYKPIITYEIKDAVPPVPRTAKKEAMLSFIYLDSDQDDVPDVIDNCPNVANEDQKDTDGVLEEVVQGEPPRLLGDACDPDDDGDGTIDEADTCPTVATGDHDDKDNDGYGVVCDPDGDIL